MTYSACPGSDVVNPHPDPLPQAGEGAQTHGPVYQRPNVDYARRMRREDATNVERVLWRALRDRRMNAKFRRQHPLGPYILDFVCLKHGLVVELDGGQHNEPRERARDQKRTAWLECQGLRVLRFWNNDVLTNLAGVLETIVTTLNNPSPASGRGRGPRSGRVRADVGSACPGSDVVNPHPDPLPQAGEGEEDSPL